MFVKKLCVAVSMMIVGSGCAASADEDDSQAVEESASTGEVSLALRRGGYGPLDYPVPVLDLKRDFRDWEFGDGDWEVPHFGREMWSPPIGQCQYRTIKIYNPARQKDVEVGVTVCP